MLRARALLLLVPLMLLAPSARADETGDKAVAEALFRAAKEQKDKGNLAEACPKFAESHRLDPKPGTILNLALCHEAEGKTATAWADFGEAATLASRAKQGDREKFARGKAAELEQKLSYVTFTPPAELANDTSLSVSVDGKALTAAAIGTKVPLDPGDHTIEAKAAGKLPWSSNVTIAEGPSEKTITIPSLEPEKANEPAPPPSAEPVAPPPNEGSSSDGSVQRLAGWIAIGVGAAGIGVGGIFGMRTLSAKDDVDAHCAGSFCDAEGLEANDRAYTSATISTIGFFAGAGVAVLGAVLLLTAPSRTPAREALLRW